MVLHVNGFLTSQVGYDLGEPKRALIRSDRREYVPDGARFAVLPLARETEQAEPVLSGTVRYWGETWNAHWWVIDFSAVEEAGEYGIVVSAPGEDGATLLRSEAVTVGDNVLWHATVEAIALDQLEERARRARNGIGWLDCGVEWREANSHASTVIGLCELLSVGFQWLTEEQVERLRAQIIHGCDYLAILQDAAQRIGAPDGALIHEIPNHMVLIPGDSAQAVVALAHAGRLLADTFPDKSQDYIRRAVRAMDYLILEAQSFGGLNFSAMNHGAPEDFCVPDEFMTRDLAMMLWGCLNLWAAGQTAYQRHAVRLAREVMARQVPESRAEDGLYGHFYTFASADFTEKANVHHHVGHDTGATFPHYIAPLLDMATRWSTHPDVPLWRECVRKFAEGYLIPACTRNPFYLLPVGYFAGKGLMSFCGPWHGINTSYGFGAALAAACMGVSNDPALRQIVIGNLQWICGLNAGITRRSFEGCVLWREEIPEGVALPYSQIYGVGRRWTGCWTGIRGAVPNGFAVNPQFQLVVEPDDEVTADIRAVAEVTRPAGVPLKVIFETAYLTLDEIKRTVQCAIDAGADFVKTSTGFGGEGATVEQVQAMLDAAQGRIKVKPSGGIRDRARAEMFIKMGAQRIGNGYTSTKAICGEPSAVSNQPSAVSDQPSANGY